MELLLSEEESGRLIANWTELNVIKPKLDSFRAGGGQVRGSIVEVRTDDSIALEARDVRVGVLRQSSVVRMRSCITTVLYLAS